MKLCGFWFRSKGNETLAVKKVTERERDRERERFLERERKWGSQREREREREREGREGGKSGDLRIINEDTSPFRRLALLLPSYKYLLP